MTEALFGGAARLESALPVARARTATMLKEQAFSAASLAAALAFLATAARALALHLAFAAARRVSPSTLRIPRRAIGNTHRYHVRILCLL